MGKFYSNLSDHHLPTPISRSGKGAEIDSCGVGGEGVHHLSDLGPDANIAPWNVF